MAWTKPGVSTFCGDMMGSMMVILTSTSYVLLRRPMMCNLMTRLTVSSATKRHSCFTLTRSRSQCPIRWSERGARLSSTRFAGRLLRASALIRRSAFMYTTPLRTHSPRPWSCLRICKLIQPPFSKAILSALRGFRSKRGRSANSLFTCGLTPEASVCCASRRTASLGAIWRA